MDTCAGGEAAKVDSTSSCVDGVSALGEGLQWSHFEGVSGRRISPQV